MTLYPLRRPPGSVRRPFLYQASRPDFFHGFHEDVASEAYRWAIGASGGVSLAKKPGDSDTREAGADSTSGPTDKRTARESRAVAGGESTRSSRRSKGSSSKKRSRSTPKQGKANARANTDRGVGKAQRPFPARPLEEALAVPQVIREKNNGND